MPAEARRLLDERLRTAIADLVRVRSGRIPGTELLDLQSPDGFLAARIASRAEEWIVHAAELHPEAPGNVEEAGVGDDALDFEDEQLAAVMAVAVDEPLEISAALVEEIHRVLVPEGRVLVLFRGPAPRAPDAPRTLPPDAVDAFASAGFDPVTETREQHLRDGSELMLLRAVKD